jgi:aspartate/tyrosine/aromatic aminotransferase
MANLADIPVLPLDEAFAVTAEFKADTFPQKVSLGAGVYRDEHGSPWVLPSVIKVCELPKLGAITIKSHRHLTAVCWVGQGKIASNAQP